MTFCNKGMVQADPLLPVVVKYHIFAYFREVLKNYFKKNHFDGLSPQGGSGLWQNPMSPCFFTFTK